MESAEHPALSQPMDNAATQPPTPGQSQFVSPAKSDQNPSTAETADKSEQRAIKTESCIESRKEVENIEENLQKYFDKYAVLDSKPAQKRVPAAVTPARGLDELNSDNDERDVDEEELYRYSQLSNKLNSALSRIEHSKFLGVKSPQRANFASTYERFEMFERKRKEDIERKTKEVEQEKLKQLSLKPLLNENSVNLSKSNAPIYERYDRLLQTKERKLAEEREKKKKQEEDQFEEYLKVFEAKNQKPDKFRSPEDFYAELVRWKQRAEQKIQEKKETVKNKEVQGMTFQPTINKRSKKLLQKTARQPIYEREPKAPKVAAEQYTFKPMTNKKVPKN